MVVQKNWNIVDASQQSAPSEEQATERAVQPCNVETRPPITRQLAINTLAAMHRRFSLPGPIQPHSRPIAEFRASANRSLDMLRQTIQSAVSKEIDQVIKKYLEKFFVPAVNNIRLNLGEDSVSEDQVRAVCRSMLDSTRLLYTSPARATAHICENSESSSSADSKLTGQIVNPQLQNQESQNPQVQSPESQNQQVQNPQSQNPEMQSLKRKESDPESDGSVQQKKIKQEDEIASPLPAEMLRDPAKWNPSRLNQDTLFIMGSHAHKVLGLGNCRGRLYSEHPGLLRYPADSSDKEWIASHNLVNAAVGKTYIMVLEDIEELATSEAYRHSSLPMLGELSGFNIPLFMLKKIRSYVMQKALSDDFSDPDEPQPSTSASDQFDKLKLDFLKVEPEQDNYDDALYENQMMNANRDYIETELSKDDFPDFKVDGIKVEDIDDIKVEDMDDIKVEDMDDMKDIKVEDFDDDDDDIKAENYDINVDNIKEEDIKLEHDDTLSVCQDAEDEPDQLVQGLFESEMEFLSRNLGSIDNEMEARKASENLAGSSAEPLSVDEYDLRATLNTNNFTDNQTTKCITVASTTSGMIHSVPVAHISAPRHGSALHYYRAAPGQTRTVLHLPATFTKQNIAGTNSQIIRGIPINAKSGTFSTVMSQGTASVINFGGRATTSAGLIRPTTQFLNVAGKPFAAGNILHNAIVSRNIVNRTSTVTSASGMTYNVTNVRPAATATKLSTAVAKTATKDLSDNATNSSFMLKKVLTLGSGGNAKSFVMHNTQMVLSTGFANGITPPPNVTIVSSGTAGVNLVSNNMGNNNSSIVSTPPSGSLSASHTTLSALLAANAEKTQSHKK